jgi:hypothetical protein
MNGSDIALRLRQRFTHPAEDRPPLEIVLIEPCQLSPAQSGPDLIHTKIETGPHYVIGKGMAPMPVPGRKRHAVAAQGPHDFRALFTVRHGHPAFSGRHVLVGKEAETSHTAPRPQFLPSEPPPAAVRSVFHYLDAPAVGKVFDRVHAAGKARIVHHDHGLGSRS